MWQTDQLDTDMRNRIVAFFDWRLKENEPSELRQFTLWLEAECLQPEWRLKACSKILDVCKAKDVSIEIQVKTLCDLVPNHTAKVLECFVTLTGGNADNNIYIQAEEAKIIIEAGLSSSDEDVYKNAESARENLLSGGKLNISDFND